MRHRCARCEAIKYESEFYASKTTFSGVQSWCKECMCGYVKYRYKNDAEYKSRMKDYAARWDSENVEVKRQRMAEYNRNNRYKINRKSRERYRVDPSARKRAGDVRRARKEQAAIVDFDQRLIQDRWAYYGDRCWMCGNVANVTDHVKPLSKGGAHTLSNLRPACRSCNSRKGNKWPYRKGIEF